MTRADMLNELVYAEDFVREAEDKVSDGNHHSAQSCALISIAKSLHVLANLKMEETE